MIAATCMGTPWARAGSGGTACAAVGATAEHPLLAVFQGRSEGMTLAALAHRGLAVLVIVISLLLDLSGRRRLASTTQCVAAVASANDHEPDHGAMAMAKI